MSLLLLFHRRFYIPEAISSGAARVAKRIRAFIPRKGRKRKRLEDLPVRYEPGDPQAIAAIEEQLSIIARAAAQVDTIKARQAKHLAALTKILERERQRRLTFLAAEAKRRKEEAIAKQEEAARVQRERMKKALEEMDEELLLLLLL